MNRSPLGLLRAALLAAAVALAPAAGTARADQASDALAKYHQPIDESIDKALVYLAGQQQKDGSFASGSMTGNVGITSLCVMAFLAKGYTPGQGPYHQQIQKGIDFVLDHRDDDSGLLRGLPKRASHGPMYGHTISALLLSEVSGMVDPARQERIDKALANALRVILSAQQIEKDKKHAGGWRYQPTSKDSDISCTGWAVMTLRSARGNGAKVPNNSIADAIEYVLRCRNGDGGFAYQPGGSSGLARTGTALLCLELAGQHGKPVTRAAGDYILNNRPGRFGQGGFFYYGLYYASQGMFQLGGKHWQKWAEHMYEMMLAHQSKKDGSWPSGSGNEAKAGQAYATAMAVLAMTVSYRQLPIYQR
ncbi:MAG: prenyltransferase/squalene oxidase repeat-containing protein [Phycisphaerae bacterium]